MDDVEDDARYPPNPHHRHNSAPRPKLPTHPQLARRFGDQDDEDDESNSDDIKNTDHHHHHHHDKQQEQLPADYMEGDEDGEADADNDVDDDNSSLESRGKRRKLDNFELVPRKPAAVEAMTAPHSKPPAGKNQPPDWSEDSTFVLLGAWGERYVNNGRKSLRSDEWSDVAREVNQQSRTALSDSQCRNRLDTLKKKYKKEKARVTENPNFKTDWVYFEKMDFLMTPPSQPEQAVALVPAKKRSPLRLGCGVDAGGYVFANSRFYMNQANAVDEMRDSPGDTGTDDDVNGNEEDYESDGLPPTTSKKKKKGRGGPRSFPRSSFRMLTDSIRKFGEIYERIESSKRQQMVELQKMRKDFYRDLESQKRQILERAQAEIAQIRQEEGEEEQERMTANGDGDDDEDDEIVGSAGNLSG